MTFATYNVENLFDLQYRGTEYNEYIPNTIWKWNKTTYRKKLQNISKVILDINPDIITLVEIESDIALRDLQRELSRQGLYFRFRAITKKKSASVQTAILSKFPIRKMDILVSQESGVRNILEAKIHVRGTPLYVYVNHWKAKSGPESKRIAYAKALKKRIESLRKGSDYIITGDLNAHYEEHKSFLKKRRHNDTNGITGINHILQTIDEDGNLFTQQSLTEKGNYNLWMEVPKSQRFSHIYKGKKEALDHIIISPSLIEQTGSYYIDGTFHTFQPAYLFSGKHLYRWQRSRTRPYHHIGKGYSDHLPLIAKFYIK